MDWKVRYINYPKHYSNNEKEYLAIITEILSKGDLILREQLNEFEQNLAIFCGTKYAVGLSNCTDSLFLAYYAAGIRPGDEVITVSHTFVATAASIHHLGAKPVLIDIADDHNMNIDLVEQAVTPRTKAIVPVHLNGRICTGMDRLVEIAKKHNLIIIEDAAQALGGYLKDKKAGGVGLGGCFSFYPAKLLGAFGDGGAIVTDDEGFANAIKLLRNHGRGPDGEILRWGFNCRMDNLHAAILDFKLKLLPGWIERRRAIAKRYDDILLGIKELELPHPPRENDDRYDVFQNYEIEADRRDELVKYLNSRGIEVMLPWGGKGIHQFTALGLNSHKLPRTEKLFKKALMIPMYPELEDHQVEYVANAIGEFYNAD